MRILTAWLVAAFAVTGAGHAVAQETEFDKRARQTEQQMTDDELFSMLISVMGRNFDIPVRDKRIPEGIPMSAGYTPGVPRLGVPALLMSDAGLGITNPGYRPGDTATALPAGIALGASFNSALARAAGALVGREARARGFNVVLGGGITRARPAERQELRVLFRGPYAQRKPWRRGHQRHAEREGHLND
jgi:beta-glucosidase